MELIGELIDCGKPVDLPACRRFAGFEESTYAGWLIWGGQSARRGPKDGWFLQSYCLTLRELPNYTAWLTFRPISGPEDPCLWAGSPVPKSGTDARRRNPL